MKVGTMRVLLSLGGRRLLWLFPVLLLFCNCSTSSQKNGESTAALKTEKGDNAVRTTKKISPYRVVALPADANTFSLAKGDDTSLVSLAVERNYLGLRFQYRQYKPNYVQLPLTAVRQISILLSYMDSCALLDSVNGLFLRGLDDYGVYSIEITEAYKKEFSVPSPSATGENYRRVEALVMASSLVRDLNRVLQPLGFRISKVNLEKIFLSSVRWEKYTDYLPDSVDQSNLPDKLLHAMTWLRLEKTGQK